MNIKLAIIKEMSYKKAKTKKSVEKANELKKNRTRRRKSKMTTGQWAIIAVMILGLIGLVIPNLPSKPKPRPDISSANTTPAIVEPVFQKEGELSFIRGENGAQITKIEIEIADDESQRMSGLMHRKSMDENQGMLFMFDKNDPTTGFWMKNTHISLDIIFTNENKEIITIHQNTEPFSERSLPPTEPALYVIEVVAGYCKKNGIKVGDIFDFEVVRE
jgi:uncharacterized membrane protein (UPF0127 family)